MMRRAVGLTTPGSGAPRQPSARHRVATAHEPGLHPHPPPSAPGPASEAAEQRPARLRHYVELTFFHALRGGLLALPSGWARPLGRALGELLWLSGVRRRTVAENLARVFPEWTLARQRRVARRCYRHFGAMVCDTVALSRCGPVELCRRLTLSGWEHLDAAEALGKGVLVLSAHLGNWEIAARPLGLYRGPFHVVVRPFNNPLLFRYMGRERERFGERQIPKRGAARELFRVIRQGGKGGVVMDQRVRPGQGIVLPFLGHPALVTSLPASVALRTGAPAVPIFAWPEPRGRYRVELGEPILPPARGAAAEREPAVAALTTRYLSVLEAAIRERPEQWLWLHRRWRLA